MTRKDYVSIAAAVAVVRDSYSFNWNPNLFRALDDVAKQLAVHLAQDNPRFDRARFLKACGVAPEKI